MGDGGNDGESESVVYKVRRVKRLCKYLHMVIL